LGEAVQCATARAVSGLSAEAHLLENALTREVATAMAARGGSVALVSEVISRVQSMPYARGTQSPATIAALALAPGAAAMDCDERAFLAAAVINALPEARREVELRPGVRVRVARAGVVAVPRIRHAVLLLEVDARPAGYDGPIALVEGVMMLPVECTARLAVGEFDPENDAVLRDPAGDTLVTRAAGGAVRMDAIRGPFRGGMSLPSESAARFRRVEALVAGGVNAAP
jgi:hypothetical protein